MSQHMSQQQPKVQSSPIDSDHHSDHHDDSSRQLANQAFLRSLSQLEQTLMTCEAIPEIATVLVPSELSPAIAPVLISPVFDEPSTSLQTAINHLSIEECEVAEAVADIEHFMEEQGIPLDSPLANHIRIAAAAEAASADLDPEPAAAAEPRTK